MKVPVKPLVAVAAAVVVAGCSQAASTSGPAAGATSAAAPSAGADPTTSSIAMAQLIHPASGKYFGVEASGPANTLAPVDTFAANAGRKPDLMGQYVAWGSPFNSQIARASWSGGTLYYMAWEPFSATVASIAAGDSNAYITNFAGQVKSAGVPVAISFGHEMNGNWYPWGVGGATPAAFVEAWRLIHALFASVGATNVIWVWNPNIIGGVANVTLKPYFPGDSYVDWIGVTGYFPMTGARTFDTLFGPTMDQIRQFTSKPFIVVETSVQTGPAEIKCVQSLVSGVEHKRDVLGFVWFEYNKDGVDWSIGDRPAIRTALASAIAHLQIFDVREQ
jgi:mannan endo-1,4-beta-mannosidase